MTLDEFRELEVGDVLIAPSGIEWPVTRVSKAGGFVVSPDKRDGFDLRFYASQVKFFTVRKQPNAKE